jgi:hypothetical protein
MYSMCPGFHFSFIISMLVHTYQEKKVGVSPLVTLPVHYLPGSHHIGDQPPLEVGLVELVGFGKTCKAMM